jgi:hypothetical protein
MASRKVRVEKRHVGGLPTWRLAALAGAMLACALLVAETFPHVAAVAPSSGKVNDDVTVTGENLGKGLVSAIFLSDDKNDYKAAIAEQGEARIIMKVPAVPAGEYNVSVQLGEKIYISTVRFKVDALNPSAAPIPDDIR